MLISFMKSVGASMHNWDNFITRWNLQPEASIFKELPCLPAIGGAAQLASLLERRKCCSHGNAIHRSVVVQINIKCKPEIQ